MNIDRILLAIHELIAKGARIVIIHHHEWDTFLPWLEERRNTKFGMVPRSVQYAGIEVWGRPKQEPITDWLVSETGRGPFEAKSIFLERDD